MSRGEKIVQLAREVEPKAEDESEYFPSSSLDFDTPGVNIKLAGIEERPTETNKPRRQKRQPTPVGQKITGSKEDLKVSNVSVKGVVKPAVQMKPSCRESCRLKCFMIPEDERLTIFQSYYKLADYVRQRDFKNANTEKAVKKSKTTQEESRRQYSINYFLPIIEEKKKCCLDIYQSRLITIILVSQKTTPECSRKRIVQHDKHKRVVVMKNRYSAKGLPEKPRCVHKNKFLKCHLLTIRDL
ncbi:unnamed protein product [Diabrotica balteata]|uniref:Uncharacterized protein n=1 Tax=Diabrotica balteata TaxID=107213 RepID=A0A9N9XL09_DIABA|nr:unnamed protein product [Diabrotica balteata]